MKKSTALTAALSLLLLGGFFLLLYPHLAQHWNLRRQSQVIASYSREVAQLDTTDFYPLWEAALAHNRRLAAGEPPPERAVYESLLDPVGSGVMGWVEIPAIGCRLPIGHGSDETTLRDAAGHVEWSSLPTGGAGTHCVLSGHRGMAGARLFTDLDELAVGDTFLLQILDNTLTYQVDQILTVLPHETQALQIRPEGDYCTLVTCTPYAVNTHRLLVRGRRVA